MIVWILMILDLIVLSAVSLAHFGIMYPTYLLFVSAGYLFIKFFVFQEIMSGIDMVFGAYIIMVAIFHISTVFYYFLLGWFLYKLVFVLLS